MHYPKVILDIVVVCVQVDAATVEIFGEGLLITVKGLRHAKVYRSVQQGLSHLLSFNPMYSS